MILRLWTISKSPAKYFFSLFQRPLTKESHKVISTASYGLKMGVKHVLQVLKWSLKEIGDAPTSGKLVLNFCEHFD